jgi:hypothetical protein
MDLARFLGSLRDVASSPLALAAYVVLACAWTARLWLVTQPQRQVRSILRTYKEDANRLAALRVLLGNDVPTGLPRSEILKMAQLRARERSHSLLLGAYVVTLVSVIVITGMAIYRSIHTEVNAPPRLIDSTSHINRQ